MYARWKWHIIDRVNQKHCIRRPCGKSTWEMEACTCNSNQSLLFYLFIYFFCRHFFVLPYGHWEHATLAFDLTILPAWWPWWCFINFVLPCNFEWSLAALWCVRLSLSSSPSLCVLFVASLPLSLSLSVSVSSLRLPAHLNSTPACNQLISCQLSTPAFLPLIASSLFQSLWYLRSGLTLVCLLVVVLVCCYPALHLSVPCASENLLAWLTACYPVVCSPTHSPQRLCQPNRLAISMPWSSPPTVLLQ